MKYECDTPQVFLPHQDHQQAMRDLVSTVKRCGTLVGSRGLGLCPIHDHETADWDYVIGKTFVSSILDCTLLEACKGNNPTMGFKFTDGTKPINLIITRDTEEQDAWMACFYDMYCLIEQSDLMHSICSNKNARVAIFIALRGMHGIPDTGEI